MTPADIFMTRMDGRFRRIKVINAHDIGPGMIESTFQILPRVGAKKERSLWDLGVRRWSDFIGSDDVGPVNPKDKGRFDSILSDAYGLLDSGDARGLGRMLKTGEHWRLYDRFRDSASFLDIETDGLERDSTVTVVTVHRGGETSTLVNGENLDSESLSEALDGTSMLVTFNGCCFDVPVLRCSFPDVDFDYPHFDLRFGCRKAGMKGGLKQVERDMGIERSENIADVDGFEAVRLWKRWTSSKDRVARDRLVEYNVADTVNLRGLADLAYRRLVRDYAGFE